MNNKKPFSSVHRLHSGGNEVSGESFREEVITDCRELLLACILLTDSYTFHSFHLTFFFLAFFLKVLLWHRLQMVSTTIRNEC